MKKLTLVLCVVLAVVLASSLQAQVRGIDRSDEMNLRIQRMQEQLRAEGHTFEIGMNEAMNYSLDQLCNLKPELASPEDLQYENNETEVGYAAALPAAFTGKCSPIKNQGSCGSCWAFGIIGAIEGQWAYQLGTYYDFSEQYLLDCNSYGYSCSGGWFSAFSDCTYPKWFKWESCYPYVARKKTCNPVNCDADYCSSWAYVGSSSGVPSTDAIKQKIYDHGAVAVAVYADSYFQAYTSGCFSRNASGSVNHAVTLCGWDNAQCTTGAWKLKNSWGTGWGMSGYMWIKYGVQKVGYAACYANY